MSVSTSPDRHLLVIGGYGVVGTAVVELMHRTPGWQLTTAARRRPPTSLLDGSPAPAHISADLLDAAGTARAFAGLGSVTDLVFCAYSERESMAATVAPNLAMLEHSLKALRQAGARLRQVVLIGGGKSYGEHLGPYKTPAKESDPRFMGPIFYNDQEDLLWHEAEREGFAWTVLRPDGVMGPSLNSPMNILTGIASFAAISQALNLPLRFPGSLQAWSALHQATDSRVLAQAVLWALTSPNAQQQVFNVTNGDHFRWQHLWPQIAGFFGLASAAPQPMNLGGADGRQGAAVGAHCPGAATAPHALGADRRLALRRWLAQYRLRHGAKHHQDPPGRLYRLHRQPPERARTVATAA